MIGTIWMDAGHSLNHACITYVIVLNMILEHK